MKALKKIIRTLKLDAMTPEFKAANAELLKAIKMNDKSGAVPHAELEAVNKAMKENDADKAGAALKKVQLQFSKAEKKLDDEVKDVTARLAEAKNAVEKSKIDIKASKADAALFDKARKAADGIKANPRNASKLSPIADKLKKYGDLSKRVSQIVTLASSNKDVSKQVDMLKKAIDTAEKKYKKESANVEKEAKKAKDALDVLNMRVKVTQGKKDAFTKERLYIANVVKQMPSGDLRQKGETKSESKIQKIVNEGNKLYDEARTYALKVASRYEDYKTFMSNYEKQCKKLVWSAYENTPSRFGSSKIKSAYKYTSFYQLKDLVSTLNEVAKNIISSGNSPKEYLGEVGDFIRSSESEYASKFQKYKIGSTENDEWTINNNIESGNERKAISFILDNIEPFKTKFRSLSEQFAANKDAARNAGFSAISLFRNLGK